MDFTGMDVPETRKDISKPENVNWLLRNLGVRNSHHPRYQETMAQLKRLS
jgi:hypothetical protein